MANGGRDGSRTGHHGTMWADTAQGKGSAMGSMGTATRDSSEPSSSWERLTLASGVVFAAIQLAALVFFTTILMPKMPPIDAPLAQRAPFYLEHGDLLALTNYLLTLPVPFLLLFLGGLFAALRRAEGGSGALAVAAFGGGIAVAMTWPMGILISGLPVGIAREGGDAATMWALDGMAPLSLALSAFPRAVLLGATWLILLGRRLAPRWVGWSGLALGVVSLLSTGTLVVAALFPFLALGTLLFEVWILALSGALLRGTRTARRSAPQAVPA